MACVKARFEVASEIASPSLGPWVEKIAVGLGCRDARISDATLVSDLLSATPLEKRFAMVRLASAIGVPVQEKDMVIELACRARDVADECARLWRAR
jgi:hypothetical protein